MLYTTCVAGRDIGLTKSLSLQQHQSILLRTDVRSNSSSVWRILPSADDNTSMEEIAKKLDLLHVSINEVKQNQSSFDQRLSDIENSGVSSQNATDSGDYSGHSYRINTARSHAHSVDYTGTDGATGGSNNPSQLTPPDNIVVSGPSSDTIQSEFQAIKDTLVRVKLNGDLKLTDSKTGLKASHSQWCKSVPDMQKRH